MEDEAAYFSLSSHIISHKEALVEMCRQRMRAHYYQDRGKGGLSLRGVAFMTVLAVLTVFGGSAKHLALLLLLLENTVPRGSRDGFGGFGGCGGFGRDGCPP